VSDDGGDDTLEMTDAANPPTKRGLEQEGRRVSPLVKYYGALATSLLSVVCGGLVAKELGAISVMLFFVGLVFFVYAVVGPRCPRCQTPLYGPAAVLPGRGFPGRYCTNCEYDLLTTKRGSTPRSGVVGIGGERGSQSCSLPSSSYSTPRASSWSSSSCAKRWAIAPVAYKFSNERTPVVRPLIMI
jgi:hypothetical protein